MKYTVREVCGRSEFRLFYQFQNRLYKDCKVYVPSLDLDQKRTLSCAPPLQYCRQKLFLAWDENQKVAGRIAAIVNPRYNEVYGTRRLRFGWFDFIEDIAVAEALIEAAAQWGRSQGMDEMIGPLGYNTLYKQGMVVEGFENVPPVNCLYNYPYYPKYMESMGFVKDSDWVQYRIPMNQQLPERLTRISQALMSRHKLKVVPVSRLKKRGGIIKTFFTGVNRGFANVHNFIPLTESEMEEEGKAYMSHLQDSLTCFVMDADGEMASFGISTPSMSQALQKAHGKLLPFGWWHLLKARKNYEVLDLMMLGSDPKWHGKGLSSIFHTLLFDNYRKIGVKYCITNPQIETNPAVKVWESYSEKEPYIRRRCYIRSIDAHMQGSDGKSSMCMNGDEVAGKAKAESPAQTTDKE